MKNQHEKITGYRQLTQNEIDLMNEVKAVAVNVGTLVQKIKASNVQKREIGDRPGVI